LRLAIVIGGDFWKVHPGVGRSGKIEDIEGGLLQSAKLAKDNVVWWANATMGARAA
jgi:hypothetical protein